MNSNIENKPIHENKNSAAISRNIQYEKLFRKSQIKESQILMGVCCSRHLQCIGTGNDLSPYVESDSLSINSDLLKEVQPKDISSEPLFDYKTKPEVDMLAQINIKKKKYEKMIQEQQNKLREQQKKERIKKIQEEARLALQKSKKIPQNKKAKWGHSVFEDRKEQNEQDRKDSPAVEAKSIAKSQQKRKIVMKPINQRIAEYRKQELRKIKSAQNFRKPHREDLDIEQCNEKIKNNAETIMSKMKHEKKKLQQEHLIRQAKIRAIQIQSLKKVQQGGKRPLEDGEQFSLGDSQYSTFQARAQGRKMQKKKKKGKQKPLPPPSLMETKKSKDYRMTKRSNNAKKQNEKTVPRSKAAQSNRSMQQQVVHQQQPKGPFYVWNMPILPEDLEKLQKPSKDVFMNIDRFNYKQGKTFREQANQYLARKMEKKHEENRQKTKQQVFLDEVERKKQKLEEQYIKQNCPAMNQVVWNEDQIFRPNVLQNFHFFCNQGSLF